MNNAKKVKADEFYTQISDIEAEMRHYKEHFKDKTIFCNCDDPYESNFFKYFALNFNYLGLKKLIATSYSGSPIAGEQLSLNDVSSVQLEQVEQKPPYKIEITAVTDENLDGAINMLDVELLLKNKRNVLTLLKGDGDFRSPECLELLIQSDVVVTNPPFSLFREYFAQLMEYDKEFIIIGNMNAVTYKDVFPFIKENRVWFGPSIHSGDREFRVPDSYPLEAAGSRIDEFGNKYIRVKGVRWFTNIGTAERYKDLTLYKRYSEEEYIKYDNFDAIHIEKVVDIPYDYFGIIGVPISFLDKYNPNQFEILGNETMLNISKGRGYVKGKRKYSRIFIKRREENNENRASKNIN